MNGVPTCTTWQIFQDEGIRVQMDNHRQHKYYLSFLRRSPSPSRRGPRSETSAPRTPIQTPKPPPTLEDLVAISDPTWNPDAGGILYPPLFYTPPTPRRVFSGVERGGYKIWPREKHSHTETPVSWLTFTQNFMASSTAICTHDLKGNLHWSKPLPIPTPHPPPPKIYCLLSVFLGKYRKRAPKPRNFVNPLFLRKRRENGLSKVWGTGGGGPNLVVSKSTNPMQTSLGRVR